MLSIEQINEIEAELQMVKQELILAQNQYNKVVEQNRELQKLLKEKEKREGLDVDFI